MYCCINMGNLSLENQIIGAPKSTKKRWVIFFISLLVLLIIFLVGSSLYIWYEIYMPADKANNQQSSFTVEKGESVKEVATKLRSENFIRSQFWFKIYVWLEKQSTNLQAGEYALSPSFSVPQILQIITGGKVIPNEIQLTFPEGFTTQQIKERLLQSSVNSALSLGEETVDTFQVQYKFLSEIPSANSLEGFLFPDTYRFKKDVSKDEIVKKFLDNFDKRLTPSMREEISRQKKTIYQIVTLASIVQQEAISEEEMPMIASIFWNRLSLGMPLESDATVNYATGKKVRQASADDIKIQSPYNTYLYTGLPPTPICNPGSAAIKAAIYPAQTEHLYFLHPLNSPAVYSKTLEEHNRNKAKYLK